MRSRGIALVTVLMATALLTLLTTSLVIVSRTSLVSGEQLRRREVLLQTCYSGLDYARNRLCQNAAWGVTGFGASAPLNIPRVEIVERGSDELTNYVQAGLASSGATFQVRVWNRLGSLVVSDPPNWSATRVKIPPRCAMVQVLADYEGVQRKLEVVLARSHVITNAIHAGRDFAANVPAQAPGIRFSSLQPRGNVLAATRDIYLPDTGSVRFNGSNGSVRSGEEVAVNGTVSFDSAGGFTPLVSPAPVRLQGNGPALSDASTRMQAQVRMGSSSHPAFTPDKLRQPSSAARRLEPGTYTFTGPDTVEFRGTSGSPSVYTGSIPGTVALQDFRFIPQGNVEVPGNLTINGLVRRSEWVPDPNNPNNGEIRPAEPEPTSVSLGLGYDPNGLPMPANSHQDRLTVTGNLSVSGDLVGNGQIHVKHNAQGGGVLDVAGNSFLSSTRTDGMALVTEELARFREVPTGFTAMPAYMFPNDIRHFQVAVPSEYVSRAVSQPTLDGFHAASMSDRVALVGDRDEFGVPGLRNQPVDSDAIRMEDFQALTSIPLRRYNVHLNRDPAPSVTESAENVIRTYLQQMTRPTSGPPRPLTLGQYVRLKEFVKSLDFGAPRVDLVDPIDPRYDTPDNTNFVAAQILNQVQAYDQDARNAGQSLRDYLASVDASNYAGRLREMIYGGLIYSEGNIFTAVTNAFNLFGGMLSRGNIGFDHLSQGNMVYDPAMLEDQFDLAQLGLAPIFFWIN